MYFILEYPFSSFSSISSCIFDIFEKHWIDCPHCYYENCCQTKPCKKGCFYQIICEKWKDISFQESDKYIVFYQQNILEKVENELIQSMNGNIDSKSILQYISQQKQDFQTFNTTWLQINHPYCHLFEYSTFSHQPISSLISILQILEPNFQFDKTIIEDCYKNFLQKNTNETNKIIHDFSIYQISQTEILKTEIEIKTLQNENILKTEIEIETLENENILETENEIVENENILETEIEKETENENVLETENEIVENENVLETEIETLENEKILETKNEIEIVENENVLETEIEILEKKIEIENPEIKNEVEIVEMEETQILENENTSIEIVKIEEKPIPKKTINPKINVKKEAEKRRKEKEAQKKKQAFKRRKIADFQQQLYIARYTKQKNRVKVLQKVISNIKKL